MTRPDLTNGLLTAALVACGLLVAALVYGFATRALTPRTIPERTAAEVDTTGQARELAAALKQVATAITRSISARTG